MQAEQRCQDEVEWVGLSHQLETLLVLQIYGLNLVFLVLMQALIQLGWPFCAGQAV